MTTILIYLVALVLALLAGVVVEGLLDRSEARPGARTLPLGAAALILLLYPAGYLVPVGVGGPVVVGVLAAAAVALATVRVRAAGVRAALRSVAMPPGPALALAVGVAMGVLVLIPTLTQGFPTAIAITNNDGWYYAGLVDWLGDHAAHVAPRPDAGDPLASAAVIMNTGILPVGFELVAATVRALTGQAPYEVIGPVAAVAVPIAVSGWALVMGALSRRAPVWAYALVGVAAATPAFVLPFTEDYLTQVVGLSLVPGAIGTAIAYARGPGLRTLLPAAITAGGVLGVYVGLLPWVALAVVAILLVERPREGWARAGAGATSPGARVRGGVVAALALCAAVAVLAPVAVVRGFSFVRTAAELEGAAGFARYGLGPNAALLLGSNSTLTMTGTRAVLLGILVAAIGLALVVVGARARDRRLVAALGIALLAATLIVFRSYQGSGFAYGIYKTMINGGSLIAGVIVAGLAAWAGSRRAVLPCVAALAACALVWVPGAAGILDDTRATRPGFRAADVGLGDELVALPPGSVLLAEGAEVNWAFESFQMRMMTAYFGSTRSRDMTFEGLWSTPTYISPGPLPDLRPDAPWDYVLTVRPSPFGAGRTPVWRDGAYALSRAPRIDVTGYGPAWYAPERDADGRFQWMGADGELIVSNRGDTPARVRVALAVQSYARDRAVTLSTDTGETSTVTARPTGAPTPLSLVIAMPARSTRVVALRAEPAGEPGGADPRTLMVRVRDVIAREVA